MIRLIFHTGPRAGTEVATTAEVIRIGRNPDQADVILADPMCSQRHCELKRQPTGVYTIEDLGSTHGTLVNRRPIKRALLAPGDQFWVGTSQVEIGDGRPRLMVVRGPMSGVEVPIGDEAVTLGAALDNHLVLAGADVDEYHAMILCLPTGFAVQDNRASRPTLVNGIAVDRYALVDGDVIGIGEHEVRFLVGASEAGAASSGFELPEARPSETDSGLRGLLVFVAGPHERLEVQLGEGVVTLGRRGDCTVVLSDPYASGQHCRIQWSDRGYVLTELKATYGTYVNGVRITQPVVLNPGDVIKIGSTVAELRVMGGKSLVGEEVAVSVIAEGAYTVAARPKFVVDGHVILREHITIGRAAGSDVFLQDDAISRLHAELRWNGQGFIVQDRSKAGTYLGGRRIVEEKLADGHVLRVGDHLFTVGIRGERLVLERIDAAAALAAIEVAREVQDGVARVRASLPGTASGDRYRTMFKASVADVEQMVAERKAHHQKKGAPMWRPTTDIVRGLRGLVAMSASVAAALALCVIFWASGRSGAALINRPLAQAHASAAFAAAPSGDASCAACHTAGGGAPDAKCTGCHAGFVAQAAHGAPAVTPGKHRVLGCASCHREHQASPRGMALGAPQTCTTSGCHEDAHARELAVAQRDAPFVMAAPAMTSLDLSQERVHEIHASVDGRCVACHGTKSGERADAKMACFRCHSGGSQLATLQCRSCHIEHKGLRLAPPSDAALLAPAPHAPAPQGGGQAGLLALAVFSPLVLLGLFWSLRSRTRAAELVAKLQEIPAESFKRLVHSINSDKCVGCNMCVTACPASVLELVDHKSTVVNFDACIQCKKCEVACNFDALRMHDADKPPPMVEMPDVDAQNQTAIAGLYLVGQAAGNPQIKNAANVGKKAVDHLARGLAAGTGARLGGHVDVVIVGAGPAGLSAALTCAERGLAYMVLEKSTSFAATQQQYYFKGKHVMADPPHVKNISRLPVFDAEREALLASWQRAIDDARLTIHYGQHVTDVQKHGELFVVTTTDVLGNPLGQVMAPRVVLAVGTMANPRKLGCPGDHLPKVKQALVDPDELDGRAVLVVGGGDAGLEVALALAGKNRVWISMRGAGPERVKPANKVRLEQAIAEGKITPLYTTSVTEVGEGRVQIKHADGRLEDIANDVVFAMIGGIPPLKWLQSLGVGYVNKPHSWSPARSDELPGQSLMRPS